ncbi:MAG: DUF354 domain-containing protein [Melioribacteraceae bacterium]|nr:DUF354 domain-containing protein [Melioribacteraceae bacterium]
MIWFDLDNSPHVPLFRPVFKNLENKSEEFIITARDFAQTQDLMKLWNINYLPVGKHGGKNKLMKILNLFQRSYQLKKAVNKHKINLAVNHGSRTQIFSSKYMSIPSVWMMDYEYTETNILNTFASYILAPKHIPTKRLKDSGISVNKLIRYNGFKEELYLNDFRPDPNIRKELNIDESSILVVFRPPSITANYHNAQSEKLLLESLKYFSSHKNTICLIVNRTEKEKQFLEKNIELGDKIRFLQKPVDGLQLLYAADIAFSGGGTMNREAALLGTKSYSIFTGKRPYLDEYLQDQGKLNFIESMGDLEKIEVIRKENEIKNFSNNIAEEVTDLLIDLAKK